MTTESHRAGDFAEKYRAYLPRVLNYMRLRVGDEVLAQDLTATTFERAFAGIDSLRSEEAFGGWIFTIARNVVAQHYRSQREAVSLDAVADMVDPSPSPEGHALEAVELQEILAGLQTLSEREQEIVRLKFIAGLKNREIAPLMGLTESNVAVILYRALGKLRRVVVR
ncbi:MAG: sigma-70 family RNA polymerase sigma factor [Chloroflexi bacterium]|nr:MAG: sigma-70 family RNA polymerase sigma factor [Chloroflexota bacterium]